ncbi:MAG: hypothetical protein JJU33_04695 [Phycisphaerales bacterium]|nr:hypothetical protein [Phycisphaerales bacterium]
MHDASVTARPARVRGFRGLSVILALGVVCLSALPAMAQAGRASIPEGLISKPSELTQDEVRQVRTYVNEHLPRLTAENIDHRRAARRELRRPLTARGVTVSFRLAYSSQLVPELRRLADNEDRGVATIALLLAGELATSPAAQLAIERLASEDEVVRYAAASSMGETLRVAAEGAPAMNEQQLTNLVNRLGERLQSEENPLVLDRVIRSIGAGATNQRREFANLRNAATRLLGDRLAERVQNADAARPNAEMELSMLRGAETVFASVNRGALSPEALRASGLLSGQLIAYADRRLNAGGGLNSDEVQRLQQIVGASENVVVFAWSLLDPRAQRRQFGLRDAMGAEGRRDRFRTAADQVIGAQGVLVRPPFEFSTGQFPR